MNKAFLISAAAAGIVVFTGGGFLLGKLAGGNSPTTAQPGANNPAKGAKPSPAVAVEAAPVAVAKLAKSIIAVGSLRSDESVVIRPEVSGRIQEILFREGQRVEKGAILIRIDDSVQRAELEQARANLSLGKSKLDRALDLQTKGFISSQAREEAENNFRVSQAAYDLASARLTKLEIKAPFAGVVGLRQVSVGDYIKDGQDIANLEGVDALKVDFRVPEIYLKQVVVNQNLQVTLDAVPDQTILGKVFAINPLIDANGRAVVVRAIIRNVDARLRPGMFARVRLLTAATADTMTLPEQSVIAVGDDFFVYRIADSKALRTKVEIGQRQTGIVEINNGLKPGDMVVTAGQLKLRDGTSVEIVARAGNGMPASAENTSKTGAPDTSGAASKATAPAAAGKS